MDTIIYYELNMNEENTPHKKNEDEIFDVINSNMTRGRWLETIKWIYPEFINIVKQLKVWHIVASIWCWYKELEKDIATQVPWIKIYGIDLEDFNPSNNIPVSKQNLLNGIQLEKNTTFAYSFFTLQYLPEPLNVVQQVYDQLNKGGVAILHMWPKGIMDHTIGKYINKHNKNGEIRRESITKENTPWLKELPGDYIIIHKKKWWQNIKLPITKAKKIHKIVVTDGVNKYPNDNGHLMYSIDFDDMNTSTRDSWLHH